MTKTPLPQEIGRTEHALAALLSERALRDLPISSTDEWIAVNIVAQGRPENRAAWRERVADALMLTPDAAERVLESVCMSGLVVDGAGAPALAEGYEANLAEARRRSADVAAALEAQVSAADRQVVSRVLGQVRDAVQELRNAGIPKE